MKPQRGMEKISRHSDVPAAVPGVYTGPKIEIAGKVPE